MKFLVSSALVLLLCGSSLAAAKRPPIKDQAKLFHPSTVAEANRLIAEIRDKNDIDLCIDTFTELPGKAADELSKLKSTREKQQFYHEFAEERADAEGVDGIYILVTTNPRNVVLIGYPQRREDESVPLEEKGGLSHIKREYRLRYPFARKLGDDPDQALLELVDHFRIVVKLRKTPLPSPVSSLEALALIAGVIGLWLVLSVARLTVASRQAKATGEPIPRLYQPATLGSLFGVLPAFQIYDRLFDQERPRADPAKPTSDHHIQVAPQVKLPEMTELITDSPPPPTEERP